jgi:TrmH family RNA methyltransferase
VIISSLDNEKIKELRKLFNKKYRKEYNKFLIEGEHLIDEAYKNGYLLELIIEEGYDYTLSIPTTEVSSKVIASLSQLDNPSHMIGVCSIKEENKDLGDKILVLDNIQDPGNLGTIIRSCVAFNIDTLVVSNDTVDIYNSKVIRASQGMIFNLNIIERELISFLSDLKDYKIYGTDVNNGNSLKSIEKVDKSAIIMGNEGNGMSNRIKELCDEFIYIDMNDKCESLNVSIATSIILYEFNK